MPVNWDAFDAWRGLAGVAASDDKHTITSEARKEGRRQALTSGSRLLEKGREWTHGHDMGQADVGRGAELGRTVHRSRPRAAGVCVGKREGGEARGAGC